MPKAVNHVFKYLDVTVELYYRVFFFTHSCGQHLITCQNRGTLIKR